MTIKPQQADFMNYTYFFKSNYRKGLHRMMMMLTDPSQFQALIENPIALGAAFGPDEVQTPALCQAVFDMGEEKRNAIANAYSSLFGYESYQNLIDSETTPYWQKKSVVLMTTDFTELNLSNFKTAVKYEIAKDSWIGQNISLGNIMDESGDSQWLADFTIIDTKHDDKSDGSGKASYTLAYSDGYILRGSSSTHKQMQINSSDNNAGGWKDSLIRANLNKFSFVDSELNQFVKTVNKITHNYDSKSNLSSVSITQDKFWIPSSLEIFGNEAEASGYPYYGMEGMAYNHLVNNSRVRSNDGSQMGRQVYWTRTPDGEGTSYWRAVLVSGELSYHYYASGRYGILLCCCF